MILPPLTAIVDQDVSAAHGWSVPAAARAFLAGGARFIQVRGKSVPSRTLLDWCDEIVTAAAAVDGVVIVNDRPDVARMAGAAGVHVGQDDLRPPAVRAVVGPSAIVGLSTHTREQILDARAEPIAYAAVGPIFGSRTKDTGYDAVGLELVRVAAGAMGGHVAIVAIGGITLDRAADVLAAGAASVAVIGDLFATRDPERRTRQYVDRLAEAVRGGHSGRAV
ncbi:MAG TPA: thiamine phosphate synthase [Vicinamibacterales bacterium]|nr:thiamine phosphate synthase [Vicinamibacterales bacterium]